MRVRPLNEMTAAEIASAVADGKTTCEAVARSWSRGATRTVA